MTLGVLRPDLQQSHEVGGLIVADQGFFIEIS